MGEAGEVLSPTEDPKIWLLVKTAMNLSLLTNVLRFHGYPTQGASSLQAFDACHQQEGPPPALAVIDISGFDDSLWPRCSRLTERNIPFLIIVPNEHPALLHACLHHGASGILVKPTGIRRLLESVNLLTEGRLPPRPRWVQQDCGPSDLLAEATGLALDS